MPLANAGFATTVATHPKAMKPANIAEIILNDVLIFVE